MKKLFFFIFIFSIATKICAQSESEITVRVFASGSDITEAQFNAGKTAIELAFGSFISTTTTLLNDKITKDEVVAISNGNINKLEILSTTISSDTQNRANVRYSIVADVTVSLTKLSNLAVSKGVSSEFNGNLFALNIKKQLFTEKAEFEALYNTFVIANEYFQDGFDYSISTLDPKSMDGGNQNWEIPINIRIKANSNYKVAFQLFSDALKSISMPQSETDKYRELNKPIYVLNFQGNNYALRNENSALLLLTVHKMLRYYYKRFYFTYNRKNWFDGRNIKSDLYITENPNIIKFDTSTNILNTSINITLNEIESITKFEVIPIFKFNYNFRIKVENHSFLLQDVDSLYNYYISVIPAYTDENSSCRQNNVLVFIDRNNEGTTKPKYENIVQFSTDLNIPGINNNSFTLKDIEKFYNFNGAENRLFRNLTTSFWGWDNDCAILIQGRQGLRKEFNNKEYRSDGEIIYIFSKKKKTDIEVKMTHIFQE